ncbi:MAG: NAD-dependent protein deacylase [Candidatus Thorarchaeota archaeon]
MVSETLSKAARIIANAEYMIALTGAGVSRESNVPTFRGPDGLWRNYDAMELATPQAFARNPELVWEWYSWRQGIIAECELNPAHTTIANWESNGILNHLITQNVDGLHRRAGSENVLEVHGDIWATKCTSCNYQGQSDSPAVGIPLCPECNNILRPDVVWFGESLDSRIMTRVHEELASADVCIVIGTSALVQPAASFPFVVKHTGGKILEVNVEHTPLTPAADVHVSGKAGETLPQIDSLL